MSVDEKGRKAPKTNKLGLSGDALEKLVARAKDDDVEAFHQIYEIFGERILNYIYRLTGSREDAEDLAQDTFILAFRKLGTLKDNRKIQSWLYRIAQNNVFQKYRGKKHYFESIDEDEATELPETQRHGVPSKSPEETVLSGELGDLVETVISELPPKYREVFVLSAVQKMSYQDISEVVDRSLASVKSDIHRARVQVRDKIKEYLGENYGMSQSF